MRALVILVSLAVSSLTLLGQASETKPAFDVASVKLNQHFVGPDDNNRISYVPDGISGKHVTLRRLLAEAYQLQLKQIEGPAWLDVNEYDFEAKSSASSTREQRILMLRSLLADRFQVKEHSETRDMRVYELVAARAGVKIHPVREAEQSAAQGGFHFHGDMREFADLLAFQVSIPASNNPAEPVRASASPTPVLNKTGLAGIYDFSVDLHPELATDGFTLWQRALEEQLGLHIESRKGAVPVLVVEEAVKIPTEN
jgi:uncharacterized protein (TIGR03435 family)